MLAVVGDVERLAAAHAGTIADDPLVGGVAVVEGPVGVLRGILEVAKVRQRGRVGQQRERQNGHRIALRPVGTG